MNIILLFSIGYIVPVIEIHLISYNAASEIIVLGFVLFAFTYTIFSFFGNYIFQHLDPRVTIFIGVNIVGISFLMLSP